MPRLLLWVFLSVNLSAAVWNSDGSLADVNAKIALATAGDIITVPAGTFTWGASNTQVTIDKAVTVQGNGIGSSNVVLSTTGPTGRNGTVHITGGGTLKGISFTYQSDAAVSWVTCDTLPGWRITECTWESHSGGTAIAACISAWTPGLVDHCTITGYNGEQEHVWTKSLSYDAAWSLPANYGSIEAVYVEDCTWNLQGYVSDIQDGSKAVFRFNTFNGNNKIDIHGTETTERAGRLVEAYYNNWANVTDVNYMFDIRGGTGMVFKNTGPVATSPSTGYFQLTNYAVNNGNWLSAFSYTYGTPSNWPSKDQIGVGPDPQVGGAEPFYIWGNTRNGSLWPLVDGSSYMAFAIPAVAESSFTVSGNYSSGATNITISAGSGIVGVNDRVAFAGDDHRYAIATGITNTGTLVLAAPGLQQSLTTGTAMKNSALTLYQSQTANPTATFTIGVSGTCMIQADRDFFAQPTSFDGTTGIGEGTTAQMNAITPTKTGVGFWVTDQGSWRSGYNGNSGLLYRWSGSAWVLYYTPLTYPHPATLGQTASGMPSGSQGLIL